MGSRANTLLLGCLLLASCRRDPPAAPDPNRLACERFHWFKLDRPELVHAAVIVMQWDLPERRAAARRAIEQIRETYVLARRGLAPERQGPRPHDPTDPFDLRGQDDPLLRQFAGIVDNLVAIEAELDAGELVHFDDFTLARDGRSSSDGFVWPDTERAALVASLRYRGDVSVIREGDARFELAVAINIIPEHTATAAERDALCRDWHPPPNCGKPLELSGEDSCVAPARDSARPGPR